MMDVPCENTFDRWAREEPDRLVAYLASDAPQHLLTFAAEIAGNALPSDVIKAPLVTLLGHPSRVVREGAIYGLSRHADDPAVRERLVAKSSDDESPGVRQAAADVVEAVS